MRTPVDILCLATFGVVLLAPAAALPAGGTDADDPARESESPKQDQFKLTDLGAYLELDYRYDSQRVETRREPFFIWGPKEGTFTDKQTQLQEVVGLDLAGYYLYRELLTYGVHVGAGLDQLWASQYGLLSQVEQGGSDRANGGLVEYDVDLGILSRKPVNLELYSSLKTERITRQFLLPLDHEMQRNGATVRFDNDLYPMELSVQRNRDKYTGSSCVFDNEDEEYNETLLAYTGTFNFTKEHQLRVDYQYSDLHQQYLGNQAEFNTRRNLLDVDDRIEFGGARKHVFETILEYQQDQGDLARDRLAVGPQLTLNHTDDLSTRYKYQFDRDHFECESYTLNRFDAELTHVLAKALTTTGDVYIGREDTDDGMRSDNAGGLVRWAYTRPNRLGTFSAGWGYQYDNRRVSFDDQYGFVIDEVVYLRDPLLGYLAHPNVILSSIIVTNLERRRVYRFGIDYIVVQRRGRTALVRTLYGNILDRQSVLVTYRYRITRGATYSTHQFDARVQEDFKNGWTPYYYFVGRCQDLSTSDPFAIQPDNLNRHRFGATYRRNRWSAGGEIEFSDDTFEPYNAVHFLGDWAILASMPDQLDVRGGVSRFWFRSPCERDAWLLDLSMDYRRSMTARMDLTAKAAYRFENDTVQGEIHGVDVAAGVEYRIGLITVKCDVEYDKLDVDGKNDDGVSIWLRIRRDFPNLLGRQ